MSRETNPWTKHRQSFWGAHAGNPRLVLWQRVYALAYGVHRRNGHAPFKPGEIAIATSIVDTETGEVQTPSPSRISEAIRQAIELGFLASSSSAKCLVVPPWGIEGGMLGSPNERCRQHAASGNTGKNRRNLPEKAEVTSGNTGNDNALTSENVASLYDSSLHLSDVKRRPAS